MARKDEDTVISKPASREIPLEVKDYLFRRNDVPDTLRAAFMGYANDVRSSFGPGVKKTRAEWASALEKFRFGPVPF